MAVSPKPARLDSLCVKETTNETYAQWLLGSSSEPTALTMYPVFPAQNRDYCKQGACVFSKRSEECRTLGRVPRRWEDNIKTDFKETGCENVSWIQLARGHSPVSIRFT
jgi:hypothetical protein